MIQRRYSKDKSRARIAFRKIGEEFEPRWGSLIKIGKSFPPEERGKIMSLQTVGLKTKLASRIVNSMKDFTVEEKAEFIKYLKNKPNVFEIAKTNTYFLSQLFDLEEKGLV